MDVRGQKRKGGRGKEIDGWEGWGGMEGGENTRRHFVGRSI